MKILKKDWLSATSTYNYMMKDPVLDWYKYNHNTNIKNTKPTKNNFKTFIMEQGNIFENKILKLIQKKLGKHNVVNINGNLLARDETKVKETLKMLKKGVPIIYSGVLHNHKTKTFGVPDILIRSDYLNRLIKTPVMDEDEKINAPKLGHHKWHYRVIDIKYMTLALRSDGEHLLNGGCIPAYKVQLNIYNEALGELQGYTPPNAYILGRRWVYNKGGLQYHNNQCFDRLGVIDYSDTDDKYVDMTKDALNWGKQCKSKAAKKWNVTKYPLTNKQLYPNMCNHHDGQWHDMKKEIASFNHELTELYMVGPKNREIALSNQIYSYKDEKCNSESLGITGAKTQTLVDAIIYINKETCKELILPKTIHNDIYEWQHPDAVEFFVDFEFKNGAFNDIINLPVADTSVVIFTIGVGYLEKNKWIYKDFTSNHLTDACEMEICKAFGQYIKEVAEKHHVKHPKCWHWSHTEQTMWQNTILKHPSLKGYKLNWCDLLKVFQMEPIVIKGALNFKLKSIAKAMHHHGFIKTVWDTNDMGDGQTAMLETIHADKMALKQKKQLSEMPILKSVIRYNEIDVKVLQEIVSYLRLYHLKGHNKRKRNEFDRPCLHTRSKKIKI